METNKKGVLIGVHEYAEEYPVIFKYDEDVKRDVVVAVNEGGYNHTYIDAKELYLALQAIYGPKERCEHCGHYGWEDGDYLYEYGSWDGGINFDQVKIHYCPVCGNKLYKDSYKQELDF